MGIRRLYEYTGKKFKTYYTITPANERINLGYDLKEARRKLLELDSEETTIGNNVADHLDEMMKERRRLVAQGKLSKDTFKSNEYEIVPLKTAFGKMAPETVRTKHIWDYLHLYRGAESPVRANREIALLSRMFSRLLNQGAIDINPCAGVERNEEVPRDRFVTDEELASFFEFCCARGSAGNRIALTANIAYLTGKALGQVLKISRTQIRDEGIEFGVRKRGAKTLVTWTPALREVVAKCLALPSRITSTYLICNLDGQPYTASGFKTMWQRLMKEWEAGGKERFTFHDLRAKAVTDMTEVGRKASDLTGHITESVVSKVYDRRRIRKAPATK